MLIFAIIIFIAIDLANNNWKFQVYTSIAFLVGAITSLFSGYVGMKIATYANMRVAYKAITSLADAFKVAFRVIIITLG